MGARSRDDIEQPGGAEAIIAAAIETLGLTVAPAFGHGASRYLGELTRWSTVGRLTGYRTDAARVRHLVVESLLLLRVLPEAAAPLLDIGTGPGVPGLILKLARPQWEIVLIEANRRRVNFLRHVVRMLALEGVGICHGRAELLGQDEALRGRFRTVTMRAVAGAPAAQALAAPFLSAEGQLVLGLGPGAVPRSGRVAEVGGGGTRQGLPSRRRFLILRAGEISGNVPRGT